MRLLVYLLILLDLAASTVHAQFLTGFQTQLGPTAASNVIVPGGGWGGATAQPPNQGNPADFGYNDNTVANFDVAQYQTITGAFNFDVYAIHTPTAADYAGGVLTNVTDVQCAADNGVFVHGFNAGAGVFRFQIDATSLTDTLGSETRCIAYPTTGVPLVLQGGVSNASFVSSLFINYNHGGTKPNANLFVSATGTDSGTCSSSGTACQTIYYAIGQIHNQPGWSGGTDVGGATICLGGTGSNYSYGSATENTSYVAANQWVTITPCVGATPTLNTVGGNTTGLRTGKIHIKGVPIDFSGTLGGVNALSLTASNTNPAAPALWLDTMSFKGVSQYFANAQPQSNPVNWGGGLWCTSVTITNTYNGCVAANLNYNVSISHNTADSLQSSMTSINITVDHQGDVQYAGTGDLNSSTCVTGITSIASFVVGAAIQVGQDGTGGIPNGTVISQVGVCGGANSITLSKSATLSTAGVTFDTGSHSDVYQQQTNPQNNVLAYNVTGTDHVASQGIFSTTSSAPIVDGAFVNVNLSNQNPLVVNYFILQSGSHWTNVSLYNLAALPANLTGPTEWRTDTSFVAVDVALINMQCSAGHITGAAGAYPVSGVTTRGGTC